MGAVRAAAEAAGTAARQGQAPLRWVRQEDPEGCAVAVIAMLTGKRYVDVRSQIDGEDDHGHNGDWTQNGVTYITVDRLLTRHGYYMQRRYEAWGGEWPPLPWSPVHYAQVVQPSGNTHFVVMDADGQVLDPLREGMHSLAGWEKINNVTGLVLP